ncbi:MAG: DUF3955 domain-containing protein [Fusobacterium sp. JB021]|nr:DUF3955 domain-containing protein [Fusobacterium sp. JB020]MDP0493231.1 DUF3955 domain-containing protein [Fusobacterium sp. JB021]MDP0506255.1 DUF3955 domain-containing protein [Fusobacterium sp. JB019]
MFKNYISSYILIFLAFCCNIAYKLIGSSVDKEGFLKEPFFLIPIGYFLFFLSILFFLITTLKKIKSKFRKNKHKLN